MQASLQEERDKLLSEKDAWSKTPAATITSTSAPSHWETEKTQLIKDRDDALEKLKAATADIQKATNESRSVKFQNVSTSLCQYVNMESQHVHLGQVPNPYPGAH